MNNYVESNFLSLAELHAETVRNVEILHQSVDKDKARRALVYAIEEERSAREAIIRWPASSSVEAQTKLLYLVFFLASTKTALDTNEMNTIMESIKQLRD